MLLTFALILLVGMLLGWLISRLKLPALLGMLLTGMILGPYGLNLIDSQVLEISESLRQVALIIILIRAGLNLKFDDLKRVGRPAILLSFLPATFEILGTLLLGPIIFGLSRLDSLILGTVLAAVSPAVIVPHMLKVMEAGYGVKKGIPQMILAGASVDDIYVIVLFTAFTGMATRGNFQMASFLKIPTSIIFGALLGMILGRLLYYFLDKFKLAHHKSILVLLSLSFILVSLESMMEGNIGFSGLIAIIMMGLSLADKMPVQAQRISGSFTNLWSVAEIVLFVLVGTSVDISYALQSGGQALILIILALIFRLLGVLLSLWRTNLKQEEKLFAMLSYIPKATVQAAIGPIPLALGLSSGTTILTVAVVAILFTAPLGAFLIDLTYEKFLDQDV